MITRCSLVGLAGWFLGTTGGCAEVVEGPLADEGGRGGQSTEQDTEGSGGAPRPSGGSGNGGSGGLVGATGGQGTGSAATGGQGSGGELSSGGNSGSGGSGSSSGVELPLRLEAESGTLSNCFAEAGGDSGSKVAGFTGTSSITFPSLDLSSVRRVSFHYGAAYAGGQIQVRVGSASGDLLGTFVIPEATGGWSSPSLGTRVLALDVEKSGSHSLVLLGVTHPNGWVATLDFIDLLAAE